jgi:hypothetical protein
MNVAVHYNRCINPDLSGLGLDGDVYTHRTIGLQSVYRGRGLVSCIYIHSIAYNPRRWTQGMAGLLFVPILQENGFRDCESGQFAISANDRHVGFHWVGSASFEA